MNLIDANDLVDQARECIDTALRLDAHPQNVWDAPFDDRVALQVVDELCSAANLLAARISEHQLSY